MNEEIKVNKVNKSITFINNGIVFSQFGVADEILDLITNLQERVAYLERSNNRREDEIMSLRDECVDGETSKAKNEKAIEYVNKLCSFPSGDFEVAINETDCINIDGNDYFDNLLNILQGSDKE